MKKLLYLVVSVLSIGVIFAAGWASGVGTVNIPDEQQAIVRSNITDDCPDGPNDKDDCPDCPNDNKDGKLRKHGFKLRMPFPPINRDDIIRLPKMTN